MKLLLRLHGHDIYYKDGTFFFDPLPDLCTLQTLVRYLTSEGFIENDEAF